MIEELVERYLFFDIFDICVAYKFNGESVKWFSGKEAKDVIDKGLFVIPYNYTPLGRTCQVLFDLHQECTGSKR